MIQYVVTGFSYCNMTPVCSEGRIYTLDAGNTSNKEKTTHELIYTHTSIRCLYACICLHAYRVFAFSATSHEILIMYIIDNLKGQSAAWLLMMYVHNYQLQIESMN